MSLTPQTPQDRHLIDDLRRDIDLARELAYYLVSDIDPLHELGPDIARARELARSCARNLDREIVRARNFDRHIVSARNLASARNLGRVHARAARDLASIRDLLKAHSLARTRAGQLDVVLRSAVRKADLLYRTWKGRGPQNPAVSSTAPERPPVRPRRVAIRAADIAAKALPVAHRARYRDEYQSELYELAAAGASWWQQMRYAIRLLDRSWELRYELRKPAARRARP
ncbi:MAG TPA: hypothetical protein VFZ32_02605 [Micromonosporaceae bacterium]